MGKSGPWTCLRTSIEAGLGVLHQFDGGVEDLGEVVGRDVGRHADGDAAGAVDDEIGNAGGQNGRLERGLVVVGSEVDGLHLDVGEQFAGDARPCGTRCNAWPRADRRRRSRSCPGRRPAGNAAKTAAPCGPACRRWRSRRGDGRHPWHWPTTLAHLVYFLLYSRPISLMV